MHPVLQMGRLRLGGATWPRRGHTASGGAGPLRRPGWLCPLSDLTAKAQPLLEEVATPSPYVLLAPTPQLDISRVRG